MRVLVGAVQDADHGDAVAADLAGDAAVEILRRHHGELAVNFAVGGARNQCGKRQGGEREGRDQRGKGFHGWTASVKPAKRELRSFCNNIT